MSAFEIHCPRCGSDDVFSKGKSCICGECGKKFQLSSETRRFQPMKLFLSYGHLEAVICKRIEQALKARGHSVWFDEEQITHGSDWRERITQGIRDSNGVISCLSRHSVRKPGVCLDELSIAIGIRGGNIKTILLEPEKDVRPPASVCHLQWLDMSNWKTYYEQGEAVFQPWFDQNMAQLFEIIESEESRDFVGQIQAIRDKLYVNYDTSKQNDLLKRLFVGREWLANKLDRWLDDPDGARLCVLYGDPGVGKSAFAAHYIHYNPKVAAGLFCEYDRPHYNDARIVAMTLAYLLACRLPSYRVVLTDILERENRLDKLNASELFDLLLSDPLSNLVIDGGHETLCIVIDGLDECAQGERNALAETLARHVPRLPKWLRVLATAREVSAVKRPLEGAYHLELHGTQTQNKEDIRLYFQECLREKWGHEENWQAALDALAERSGGIFLYAQLVTKGILADKMPIGDMVRFPDGLSAAFCQWFGWFFPDDGEYMDRFRLPLGMLLAAPEPLPTEELKRVFQWDDNRLEDFLRRMEVLLRRDVNVFRKDTVTFSHLYIAQWLDSREAGRFQSRRSAALEEMAKCFYAVFQQDVEKLTEFEALYLADLLEECGDAQARHTAEMSPDLFWRIIDAGDFCKTWGNPDEAARRYRRARTMAEWMAARRNQTEDRRNLSISYQRSASILKSQGNSDGAKELYQKNLALSEQLVQERGTLRDRRDLSFIHNGLAAILKGEGDLKGAKELYEKGLAIREQLVRERGTPEDYRDLGFSYDRVAYIRKLEGNLDGAKALYEKNLAIAKQLAEKCGTLEDRRNLCVSYDNIANILKNAGDLRGAKALYERGFDIAKQLADERGAPRDRRDLSISCDKIASIRKKEGDLEGAKALYEKGLDIRERLVRERGTLEDRRDLSVSYHNIADILKKKGDLSGAKELYDKALIIREYLVQERGTLEDRKALSISYHKIASMRKEKGDLDGAKRLYEKEITILEQLVQKRGTMEDLRDLSTGYHKLVSILKKEGDLDRAKAFYKKELAIRERLPGRAAYHGTAMR